MQLKMFTIPVTDDGIFTTELNTFLRTHKVLEINKELVSNEVGAYWCFCISYIEGASFDTSKTKVDYKEVLTKEEFERFSKMRVIRKELAANENISAYIVFTDEELSEMAKLTELTPKAMLGIKGIGEKKMERYAPHFIEKMQPVTAE